MKKNIIFAVVAVLVIALVFVINVVANKGNGLLSGKYYVEMAVKDYGKVVIELDADIAPITVTNFMKLVDDKVYDGLTFHRIIKDFMVQGGEASELENKQTIKGEFAANGVENPISHIRGVISMARSSNNYNSASTQFFIVHQDSTSLDGNYAGFGNVINGMDVIDAMAEVEVIDNNGTVEAKNQPVIEYIKEISSAEAYTYME